MPFSIRRLDTQKYNKRGVLIMHKSLYTMTIAEPDGDFCSYAIIAANYNAASEVAISKYMGEQPDCENVEIEHALSYQITCAPDENGILHEIKVNDDSFKEAIIDISLCAGYLLSNKKISVDDSRELINYIRSLALKFEILHGEQDDYLTLVEDFAIKELTNTYGVDD